MQVKYSILIPTLNRLEYLKFAVESVVNQKYINWEIIISDNNSSDDVAGYINSLHENRIKYHKTEAVVPVTENWNNALNMAKGEYIIMLGDDDALTSNYLIEIDEILDRHKECELIYTGAMVYCYPGVLKEYINGYIQYEKSRILNGDKEYILNKTQAHQLVKDATNFNMSYSYNMQFSVIRRELINRVKRYGEFYQSPYPDFYATNAVFLSSQFTLIYPKPLVIIGITPKSYGFYHFNKSEKLGAIFLKNSPNENEKNNLKNIVLPGSNNNTSWLYAMEALSNNFKSEYLIKVNYKRYRRIQILNFYKNFYVDKKYTQEEFDSFNKQLTNFEKIIIGTIISIICILLDCLPNRWIIRLVQIVRPLLGQLYNDDKKIPSKNIFNITHLFDY